MNPPNAPQGPAVANVRLLDVDQTGKLDILVSDMRYGLVMRGQLRRNGLVMSREDRVQVQLEGGVARRSQTAVVDLDLERIDGARDAWGQ